MWFVLSNNSGTLHKRYVFYCSTYALTLFITRHYFVECSEGRYGLNCSQLCGHCKEKTQCHHISGFCAVGCDSGYWGARCTQSGFFKKKFNTKKMNQTIVSTYKKSNQKSKKVFHVFY